MLVTKVCDVQLATAARELCKFIAQYYNVIPNKFKHTLGDILICKCSTLHDNCRRACYTYNINVKHQCLEEAELLLVDVVGVVEMFYDMHYIDDNHKGLFDIQVLDIGKQVAALRLSAEKRLGRMGSSLAAQSPS